MHIVTALFGLFLGVTSIKAFTTPQDASIEQLESFMADSQKELNVTEQQWLRQFQLSTVISFLSYVGFFIIAGLLVKENPPTLVIAGAIAYESMQYILRKRSIQDAATIKEYLKNSKWERSFPFRVGELLEIIAIAVLVIHLFQ